MISRKVRTLQKNTKERLMIAAVELFATKGFDGTGVDEIAQSIGLKGPNLYKYYKGKDDLLNEIVKTANAAYNSGREESIRVLKEIHSGKELKDYTLQFLKFTLRNEMAQKMRRIFTIEQYRNEMLAERATERQMTDMMGLYEGIFQRLMKEGVMVKEDPKLCALEFVAPITLMIQYSDRYPDKTEEAIKMAAKHMDLFLDRFFEKKQSK